MVRGLAAACHPGPTALVTVFAVSFALLVAGAGPGRALLIGLAVLLGQLSIGWSNDAADARRDSAAGRRDKPVAGGTVAGGTVAVAAGIALAGCAVASLALGPAAGVVHLAAVASGWAYNLVAKFTVASPVPFAVSFALLPAVVTLAARPSQWPDAWTMATAGALGVAAHFANTVGDAEADAATGVRGLPQRIGPGRSMVVTAGFVLLGAVLPLAASQRPGTVAITLFAAGAVVALAAIALRGRRAFPVTLVAVALVVAGLLAG